ncbi:PepSY-associated TM helix domain-containing protein [Swaminathania salitolerans]|uniref:Peptidase n=1 Tax=Swaminathania salitolerans TaxID=182838 RepID=A0A511BSV0_9PROT|nr:PepSY-associated TM helix domain-containing protein [Swaminathania salitolerans]GBQ13212.1 hypothetical protein AA21291_1429 [Swaminathania salitolerans LMG 21291]GEL03370.1 peptidase [Swaminathania salitolerans]
MKLPADLVALYREVHSWVGIVTGLFLFVAFYAGAITMFAPALDTWLTPKTVLPPPVSLAGTPALLEKVFAAYPESRKQYTIVLDPDADRPARVMWPLETGRHGHGQRPAMMMAALDERGTLVTATRMPSVTAQTIDIVHERMGVPLPETPALLFMGVVTLAYTVALVSGIVVFLPALARGVFAVRLVGSIRRKWLDLHNLLGFCSLPFHVVMALTSVIFAFHGTIAGVQMAGLSPAAHDGASMMARFMASIPRPSPPGPDAGMLPPARVLAVLAREAPDFEAVSLDYGPLFGPPTGAPPMLRVNGYDRRHIMRGPEGGMVTLDPYTGAVLWRDYMPGLQSGGFAVLTAFFALHFGSYGGAPIRWAYLVLGFAGAFLFYTGNRLWIVVRRRRERSAGSCVDTRGTRILSRLTTGCSAGCMSSIAVLLGQAMLMPGGLEASSSLVLYHLVFWAFMALAFVPHLAARAIFALSGGIHIVLAAIVISSHARWDLTACCLAVLSLCLGCLLCGFVPRAPGGRGRQGRETDIV